MNDKLFFYRFEFLLFTQLAILFGSLIFPLSWFDQLVSPILFLLNLLAGLFMFIRRPKHFWFMAILGLVAILSLWLGPNKFSNDSVLHALRLFSFFLFYIFLCLEIIGQVWKAEEVRRNVIFGLISGYITLGLIGFFICLSIEIYHPGSFNGLPER